MFGIKNAERELYERLLQEKERLIVALSDQVDWHRAHSGTYVQNHLTDPGAHPADNDVALEQVLEGLQIERPGTMYLDEDEEELAWQAAHGADPEVVRATLAMIRSNDPLPFDQD